jgi:hypothetical protein
MIHTSKNHPLGALTA